MSRHSRCSEDLCAMRYGRYAANSNEEGSREDLMPHSRFPKGSHKLRDAEDMGWTSYRIIIHPSTLQVSKVYTSNPPLRVLPNAMLAPHNDTRSSPISAKMPGSNSNATSDANKCPYLPSVRVYSHYIRLFIPSILFISPRYVNKQEQSYAHCITLCLHLSTISICP